MMPIISLSISHRPSFRASLSRDRRDLSDVLAFVRMGKECLDRTRRRAVIVYENEPLRLRCDPCNSHLEKIHWTKQPPESDERRVKYDSRSDESQDRLVLDADMALEIRRTILSDDGGIYRCKTKREYGEEELGYYNVEVIPLSPNDIEEIQGDDKTPKGEEVIEMKDRTSVEVYTHWSEWGRCNACESQGSRVKLGYCYAIRDLKYYSSGVPCHSILLPDEIKSQIIKKRKNVRVIEDCIVPCDEAYEKARDESWNVHGGEIAQIKGLQGPELIRRVARVGSTTELQCPRVGLGMVATWYNGTRRIDQKEILSTNGKLTESIDGSLVIADVQRLQAGRYECRVDRQTRAVYRLVVIASLAASQEDILKSIVILTGVLAVYFVIFIIMLITRHCTRVMARKKRRR
ncbi:Ig-like V-type domain-containing protein FAM187A [Lytechinus pictus]|uniref:Ig-like V-type domain-containing protein FAM187A n=1 Tax=Lytechinus pictus TaxID=7653 RepID=UPI0030BA15FC